MEPVGVSSKKSVFKSGFKSKNCKNLVLVYILTMILYGIVHANRTVWAYSQAYISDTTFFTDETLGVINMMFLLAYAFGMFYNGWLGDQSNLRKFLAVGCLLSIIGSVAFTTLAINHSYSIGVYSALWILNGFGQSRLYPGLIAILGNWISTNNRGISLGIWMSNLNLGNIAGQQLGKFVINTQGWNWGVGMYFVAFLLFFSTISLYLLKTHPKETEQDVENKSLNHQASSSDADKFKNYRHSLATLDNAESKGIGFFQALKTPGLIKYSIACACVKGAIYGLLFWLPNYLVTVIGFTSETATIGTIFEFGQLFGTIVFGYCSDKIGKRSLVVVFGLYASAIIFIYITTLGRETSASHFATVLFAAGFTFGAPEAIIGSAIASDLGDTYAHTEDVKAISTIAGIINGTGSIGAGLIQLVVPHVKENSFVLYFILCIVAGIILTPTARRELGFGGKKSLKDINEKNEV